MSKKISFVLAVFLFMFSCSVFLSAGNVIVRDGELNITGDFYINETMFFVNTTSGYVGVGTASPSATLDVVGTIEVGDGTLSAPSITFGNDTNVGFYRVAADQIGFVANGGLYFQFTAGSLLHSSTGGPSILGGVGTATNPVYSFYGDANSGLYRLGADQIGLITGGSATNGIIINNGSVGIGTTSPQNTLNVIGDINATTNISTPEICLNGDCQTAWPSGSSSSGWNDTGTVVELVTGTDDVNLTSMYVNQTSGNVGIGTASPRAELHVNADNEAANIILESDADQQADIAFKKSGNSAWVIRQRANSNDLRIYDDVTSNTDVMTFQAGGNVGINTTSPNTTLHVQGDINVTFV